MCISVKAFKKQDAVNFLIHEKLLIHELLTQLLLCLKLLGLLES